MTVRLQPDGSIVLQGQCDSEDAEILLQQLLAQPGASVDWRTCAAAHTAVIQVLLASRPPLLGPPAGTLLQQWLAPLLTNKSP